MAYNNEPKLLAPIAEHIPEDTKVSTFAKPMADKKADFFIEIALVFILGILIGIAVKTEAAKRITIGFNDYQVKKASQNYDINKLGRDLIGKKSNGATADAPQPLMDEGAPSQ